MVDVGSILASPRLTDRELTVRFIVSADQIIRAVDLDAVTGVINHSHVGVAGLVGEIPQRAPHL